MQFDVTIGLELVKFYVYFSSIKSVKFIFAAFSVYIKLYKSYWLPIRPGFTADFVAVISGLRVGAEGRISLDDLEN